MRALVTGGGGFLGGAIVRLLLADGHNVRSFSRREHPELDILGVETCQGNLAEEEAIEKACRGCDIVFHVAAKAGIWGEKGDFYRTNVTGTENVIRACLSFGIDRLVYTSSPSVVFDGKDMEGADESVPYPRRYKAAYPSSKAAAERLVVAAADARLATVVLRPHLIWGPGDTHLVPGILSRARSGRLRRIGRSDKLVDFTYVGNAAQVHVEAANRLSSESIISGKVYCISDGKPLPLWDFVNRILEVAELPPVTRTVSPRVAYSIGWLCENLYRGLSLSGEPPLTRFLVEELATAHWFDISAARRELGYQPRVTMEEGLGHLKSWLQSGEPSAA